MAKLKGLGRGLDALLSSADSVDDRLMTLSIERIAPGKYQPRSFMQEEALEELASSIRAQGVIQPLIVREVGLGDYELIAGERRWRAAAKAGLTEVPVVVKNVPDEAALAMALIENIQRQELDAIEEAQGLKRLIDEFGMTHESAADAVGRSRSAVSNILRLLALPEPVQQLMHQGQLEMGHARALLALPVVGQIALAQEVVNKGLSVRQVERRVQLANLPKSEQRQNTPRTDPDITRLAEQVSEQIGAKVSIHHASKGHGRLIIDYSNLDELEALLFKLQAKVKK